MLHMDLILEEYGAGLHEDTPWINDPDQQPFDFDTVIRLIELLGLMTMPAGGWVPDYRELTNPEMLDQVSQRPDDI